MKNDAHQLVSAYYPCYLSGRRKRERIRRYFLLSRIEENTFSNQTKFEAELIIDNNREMRSIKDSTFSARTWYRLLLPDRQTEKLYPTDPIRYDFSARNFMWKPVLTDVSKKKSRHRRLLNEPYLNFEQSSTDSHLDYGETCRVN